MASTICISESTNTDSPDIRDVFGADARKDPLKAIQWYKRAAMLGDTPAMYKMGMIQLKGLLGQPKNPREVVWRQPQG